MFLIKGYKEKYYIKFQKPDGKWTQISTGTNDEILAGKKLDSFKKNRTLILEEEVKSKKKVVTLADMIEKYLLVYNLKDKDCKYLKNLFQELISVVGNKALKDFSVMDAEKYKQYKSENVYRGRKTVYACNLNIRVLKSVFNKCIKLELLNKNVWKDVKQNKIPEKKKMSFSEIELTKLLSKIDSPVIKNIVEFNLYTGCRLNEILNLKWDNVNFTDNLIEVVNSDSFTTKSKKNRFIPISTKLKDLLLGIRRVELYGYVFVKDSGYKYAGGYISKKFKSYIRKAKLDNKFHFHCLRHTFITNLIKSGVNINYVKELAGHANIQTTMNYIWISHTDLREAVNLINF